MRRNVVWSTLAYGGSRAATLVSTLILARLLVPEDFGVVAAILAYLAVVEVMSDLGLQATVVYEQEHGITERVRSALTLNIVVAATLALIAFLAAPLIAGFFDASESTWLFRLASLSLLLTGAGNIPDGILLRGMEFRRRMAPQLTRAGVRAVVSIGLAAAGLGAASLVIGLLAGAAVSTVLLWTMVPLRPRLRLDRTIVRSMLGYGSGAVALEIMAAVGTRLDLIIVAKTLGETALGLYTIAYRLPELLLESVAWNISLVAFPALAKMRGRGPGMVDGVLRLMRACALYALPVGVALAISAPALVDVLFGAAWEPAAGVLAPVALMCAVTAITFPLGDVFKALGRQRVLVVMGLVGVPLMAVGMVAASSLGLTAAAWARAAAGVLQCLVTIVFVSRTLKIRVPAMATALSPGLCAALGVLVCAGGLRLLWPDTSFLALAAQLAASAIGATAGLACADPGGLRRIVLRAGPLLPGSAR
jgi:PST family polysaccharide transporter